MARPTSAYFGDDFQPLHHDSHVGINMGSLDPLSQQPQFANPHQQQQPHHHQHHQSTYQSQQQAQHIMSSYGNQQAVQPSSSQRQALQESRGPAQPPPALSSPLMSSSSSKYVPNMPGTSSSSSGLGSLGYEKVDSRAAASISAYASPRLAHAHAHAQNGGFAGREQQGSDRYMASGGSSSGPDPSIIGSGGGGRVNNAYGSRDSGLGRSLSMGHVAYQNQHAHRSQASNAGSAYLNPHQSSQGFAQGGQQHHLHPTSPTSSSNPHYTLASSPGSSSHSHQSGSHSGYAHGGGDPSSTAHPAGLLPTVNTSSLGANHLMANIYSSGQRTSTIADSSGAYGGAAPRSPGTIHDSTMANPYSPSSSSMNRYGGGLGGGHGSVKAGSGDSSQAGALMDLGSQPSRRDSMQPSPRLSLNQRSSQGQLRQQYDSQALASVGDTLPYAYSSGQLTGPSTSSYMSQAHPQTQPNALSPRGPPPRSSGGGAASSSGDASGSSLWPQSTGSTIRGNNSMEAGSSGSARGVSGGDRVALQSDRLSATATSVVQAGGGTSSRNSVLMAKKPSQQQSSRVPGSSEGFRRVRDLDDLRPIVDRSVTATSTVADGTSAGNTLAKETARRADPAGGFVSPLKALTAYLHHTYHLVNPSFFYELSFNPRRVLTKPSKPVQNDGHDNEDSDYILYVNDWLGTEEGHKYLILDILGQGTFGQVVKCQDMTTHEIVAVKVIKNKPAYFNQSMMEVTVLEMLNGSWDPNDEHHILRLKDTFIHAKHLCLVLELLSSNLYELIKQNSFRGLSTSLVRVFTAQLLDALTVLNEARLIHCDLKPENILLKTLQTPSIKLVDFGSACHEKQTVYTYIQSRFYRSPEVLLGLPYSSAIDMWSLGCIAVELFLGLPLFPGTSEYNQVCRIVEMLGLPPSWMLEQGKQTGEFFQIFTDEFNRKSYRLKSLEQYSKEHNVQEQPSKKYFSATTLPDIIKTYPMSRKSGRTADVQKEMANRNSFVDFVSGLLNMNPHERWTPQQAKLHPFITGEKFTKPFRPPAPASSSGTQRPKAVGADPAKHPYGGLPQTAPRSSGKSYQDAAAYNQHLAQQQAYNSAHQAAAARQAQPVVNNPYAREEAAAAQVQAQHAEAQAHAKAAAKAQAQIQAQHQAQAQAQAQNSLAGGNYDLRHSLPASQAYFNAASANVAGGGSSRQRADAMNRMSIVPPQVAKLGTDVAVGGGGGGQSQALAPGANRDDSLREWERKQNGAGGSSGGAVAGQSTSSGKHRTSTHYQQLDTLQQHADLAGASSGWGQTWGNNPPFASSGGIGAGASSMHSPISASGHGVSQNVSSFSVVVDGQDRRGMPNPHESGQAMSKSTNRPLANVGNAGLSSPNITAPPAAYSSTASAGRYQPHGSSSHHLLASSGAGGVNSGGPVGLGVAGGGLLPTSSVGMGGAMAAMNSGSSLGSFAGLSHGQSHNLHANPVGHLGGLGGGGGGLSNSLAGNATAGLGMGTSGGGGGGTNNTLPFDIYDSGMSQLMPPTLTPVRIQDREREREREREQREREHRERERKDQIGLGMGMLGMGGLGGF
ncbi:hypothetical protein IE53DRAFT_261428 [Violaceomyces palustris]|uniref:Uncharacterized protein n=1 Tax=Violaceomyces palustris TaxID=1673888 RepID=A0ACD0NN07_9BASI|nr:hypothetical protein IE53DRAFT_261428 [Violaceomyces palustris]